MCHCRNTGGDGGGGWTLNKSKPPKLTLEKKNSPVTPAGVQTHNLSIMSPALLPTSYPANNIFYRPSNLRCNLMYAVVITTVFWIGCNDWIVQHWCVFCYSVSFRFLDGVPRCKKFFFLFFFNLGFVTENPSSVSSFQPKFGKKNYALRA